MVKKKIVDDEINFLEVILYIWYKKFKVFLYIGLTIVMTLVHHLYSENSYNTTTEIRPVSDSSEFQYHTYNLFVNELNFNRNIDKYFTVSKNSSEVKDLYYKKITKSYLLELYLEQFIEEDLNENVFVKELFKNDFLKPSIHLYPPKNNEANEIGNYWKIKAEVKDKKNWVKFLKNFELYLNEAVRLQLIQNFQKLVSSEKKLLRFKIEDLEQRISFTLSNHDNKMVSRLAFLNEQALIARELNIQKHSINQNISDEETGPIYYMRGYQMIEKEIELIKSRINKKVFVDDLEKLEKIEDNLLLTNKQIGRLENIMNETPITSSNKFIAAKLNHSSTIFVNTKAPLTKKLLFAAFIGIILGLISIFIENKKRILR
jgi:hypothetical protein